MKKIATCSILLLMSFACGSTVSAHDLAENGTGFLLVHIDPGEVAVAQKPVTIDLDIKNSEKGFDIRNCNCVFTISQVTGEDEKELLSIPLVPTPTPGEFNAQSIPFTFPNKGEYHLNVDAKPTTPNLFTPFELEVKEQVLPVGSVPPPTSPMHTHGYPRVELAMALIFTIVMGYFLFSNNESLARRISRK